MSENTTISAPEAEMGAGNQPVKKKAVSRKEMSKLAWTLKEMKKNYVAYLMVAPFYIIFLLLYIVQYAGVAYLGRDGQLYEIVLGR